MAIKKGAFELYTQERKLPERKISGSGKKNHFFDEIDKDDNGSQSVHNEFTKGREIILNGIKDVSKNPNGEIDLDPKEIDRGIKKTINDTPRKTKDDFVNGSQSVHNRSSEEEGKLELVTDETVQKKSSVNQLDYGKKLVTSFSKIVGNQREIVIALYKNMRINKSDTTEELTLETIANITGINPKSLKNTLFRLTSAGVVIRADQKVGRGGWVKYQINPEIIEQIKEYDFLTFSKIRK